MKRTRITEFFETASLGAPENAVGFVLWRVVHRYQRDIDRVLVPLELTHLQFTTLMLIAWHGQSGEAVAQTDLAKLGDIHPMQISNLLKTLETKALVVRPTSAADVRAKQVEITPAGLKKLRAALPLAIETQRKTFGKDGLVGGRFLDVLHRIETSQKKD